jgi:hypothetical protein
VTTGITLTQRRTLLKSLSALPVLPFAGWNSLAFAATKAFSSAQFKGMPAPDLAQANIMATTAVGSVLEVSYQDGSKQEFPLSYEPFFITGDWVSDGKGGQTLAGGYYDIHNQPIIDRSVAGKDRQFFSDCPDGMSLLQLAQAKVPGVKGHTVFAVVQFEYTNKDQSGAGAYGTLPSPIAVLTLDQNPDNGQLKLVKYHNVDTSAIKGLWITCGSSLSPWNTHLSSEEYEPDAFFAADNKVFKAFSQNLLGSDVLVNPYHYGHLPEVTVLPDGTGKITKHYCLGRISHELVQVMPDNRTVLMGDDATNGGLFLFIADKPKDLSAGTLYVAKVSEGFSLDVTARGVQLQWIRLGHASSAEIQKLANQLKPTDIMTVHKSDPQDASFSKIFYNGQPNWVKLKPGMEKAAAFLETHRYAYLVGASMAFSKMEGTTVNIKDKVAYSALQNIQDSMIRGAKGWDERNGIHLDKPLIAGGVLAHALKGGQIDSTGQKIVSDWVPAQSRMVLLGQDIEQDPLGNLSHPDRIANPDNLKFSEKLRTLLIGEDSSTHVNNFVWAYNVDTGKLNRLMSMPSGAEATGLGVVDSLNGFMYITCNFQHVGDWLPKLHDKVKDTLDPLIRANYKDRFGSAVGYLTAKSNGVKLG